MKIRLIEENEYLEVSKMIERAVKNSYFADFYPEVSLEYVSESLDQNGVKERASSTHFYIAIEDKKIIGCGAIGPYYNSKTESSLFSIFVEPSFQKQGVGRKIIETLENDEYFIRSKRIEIPASMPAIPFYRKMGYKFKNDELIYEDGHFALEKHNKK